MYVFQPKYQFSSWISYSIPLYVGWQYLLGGSELTRDIRIFIIVVLLLILLFQLSRLPREITIDGDRVIIKMFAGMNRALKMSGIKKISAGFIRTKTGRVALFNMLNSKELLDHLSIVSAEKWVPNHQVVVDQLETQKKFNLSLPVSRTLSIFIAITPLFLSQIYQLSMGVVLSSVLLYYLFSDYVFYFLYYFSFLRYVEKDVRKK